MRETTGNEPATPAHPAALRILTITDGRAGNRAQAEGLAEAIARARPAHVVRHDMRPAPGAAWLPAPAWHALGRLSPGLVARAHGGWPAAAADLVIGAGRRAAPLIALLGRRGARTVHLLDPRIGSRAFDLVVVPEHDRRRGPGVATTLGAIGRVTPARVAREAAAWADRMPDGGAGRPRLAVLVGGPGPMARWGRADGVRLVAALRRLAASWTLLVTTSRRTDPAVVTALGAALGPGHLLHAGTGENPYPAILGLAEAAVVTEDSVNMACEAAHAGLPVHVFRLRRATPKARRFHAALRERGIARDLDAGIGRWSYPPLAEADRVAGLVLARLFPGP